MSDIKLIEKLRELCKLSDEELIEEANEQIATIINTEEISEDSCIKLIIYALQVGAKADGVLCAKEYEMAKTIFTAAFDSIDEEAFLERLERPVDIIEIELLKDIISKISATGDAGVRFAHALCKLMMCIIAIDKIITTEEFEVLDAIFDDYTSTLGIICIDWDSL